MRETTPIIPKKFARLLLTHELASGDPAEVHDGPAFRVCEKLRKPLGRLMGVDGFRALLMRARTLAGTEVPWLLKLEILPDGSWEDISALQPQPNGGAVARGEVTLLGHLLGLLVVLIGPALTLRLVYDIWPNWEINP